MGMYGYVLVCMGIYGYVWVYMGMYGHVCIYMGLGLGLLENFRSYHHKINSVHPY